MSTGCDNIEGLDFYDERGRGSTINVTTWVGVITVNNCRECRNDVTIDKVAALIKARV